MPDPHQLHHALMKPGVLHILRAAGFHSTRPSVLDALTTLAEQYLVVLARKTADHAFYNHNTTEPTLTDVRLALEECGALTPTLTATEEAWREVLRKPIDSYAEGARTKMHMQRDEEDLMAIRGFEEWVKGERYQEIKRVAGLLREGEPVDGEEIPELEDYLTVLKKKHSKTGEESRYQGTVLGKPAEDHPIKIEGGAAETLQDWIKQTQERAASRLPTPIPESIESRTITQGSENADIAMQDSESTLKNSMDVDASIDDTIVPSLEDQDSGPADTQIKEEMME